MAFINQVSNSKLDAFRECHFKYYAKYHDHLPEKRSDSALHFGSYIHKIFEIGIREFTLSGLEQIAIQEKENYKFDEKEYTDKKIKKCLQNFLEFNTKLKKSETIGLELREEFKIDDFNYVGIIDRLVKSSDGSILVIDYKTSKREKTKMDLYMDKQLVGYAIALSKKLNIPISKITCAHFYPITGNFVPITYSDTQKSAFLKDVRNLVWSIRKKTKEQFLPIKNQWCNWCPFLYLCPMYHTTEEISFIRENIEKGKENEDKSSKEKLPKS